MRRQDTVAQVCSVARTVGFLGDIWTILILRDCFFGLTTFSAIQKSLDINKNRLAERLNRLVDEGILRKNLYDESRNRYEYKLTRKGVDLYPILMSIVNWGDKYKADDDGPPLQYRHRSCGHVMTPTLCCSECGEALDARQVQPVLGEGITRKLERGELTGFGGEHFKQLFGGS
ncbi:helix-turn-helix transcriptional regulator [Pseudomaricurvus alkylphenolicus]|uniref:winged helix-turn-helix transcriptional regulator n=1 Tax=Pseudomaricurvus alkylphenolicus TaxID=1306991 RepID=UPI0014247FF9|nr:helix-turn-helix domain-containing protein [Pseudomaricurvus alkylphenolicus]NIB40715.1 helix-turn-helix transcriptional regulator [Pseudomaricurvus alkylphenolicus]